MSLVTTKITANSLTNNLPENLVVMGRIVAPYGVFGWLKVVPDTETMDSLFDYDTWWLGKDDNWRELNVVEAKIHNDVLVVKLQGIDDRDAAFACKGKQIAVPRDALPEAAEEVVRPVRRPHRQDRPRPLGDQQDRRPTDARRVG